MWNSVVALPAGAIVCADSSTTWPSWYVQRAFNVAFGEDPSVTTDA
jgi:hypothetical protein